MGWEGEDDRGVGGGHRMGWKGKMTLDEMGGGEGGH